MNEHIASLVFAALRNLFERQPDLSSFTPQTNEREPNLSFHFANELWPYLFWLNCDLDVTKPDMESKRPDVIFHRRGTHLLNVLVVEVKRRKNPVGVKGDLKKIKNYWFGGQLAYCFGASVLLDEVARTFSVVLSSNFGDHEELAFTSDDTFPQPRLPVPSAPECKAVLEKINEAVAAKGGALELPLCGEINAAIKALYIQ